MNRKFGIELEIVGISKEKAVAALKAVNINLQVEGYNHETKQYWKIVPDNSLSDGFEVVSPIMHGEDGLEEVEIVARALEDAGAYANKTCGFHVHFDASQIEIKHVKAIFHRYSDYETEIDAFMPPSRRGNINNYCKSLHNLAWATFDDADNMISLANAQDSRYYKVNLRSYQRHGTIEFRQHSGTVNFVKICNWVRFLSAFIDESIRIADNNGAAPISAMPGLSPANRKLLAIFEATGTATLDEICFHMGWLGHTARSAIARLRKLGLNITSQKMNGMAGYRLNGQTGNFQGSTLWAGIDKKLVLFYQRRAAVLAIAA